MNKKTDELTYLKLKDRIMNQMPFPPVIKQSNKLSIDQQIRIAALNYAIIAWPTCKENTPPGCPILTVRELADFYADYIREGIIE